MNEKIFEVTDQMMVIQEGAPIMCIFCLTNSSPEWWKCCPEHTFEQGPSVVCRDCVREKHPEYDIPEEEILEELLDVESPGLDEEESPSEPEPVADQPQVWGPRIPEIARGKIRKLSEVMEGLDISVDDLEDVVIEDE